ncbi:MAG: tRNA (adenosine(37)-N6)-dimethylallyltransferase MiaA [Candidatus Omnitrophota bacterium]
MKNKVLIVVGPTASGKTDAAFAIARITGGEIISCDSMQVYRDMPVLTQAPPDRLLREIPHHLISIISPEEEYSAAKFRQDAGALLKDIVSRKRVPVIAGGTGLYLKALLDGLFDAPEKDPGLRYQIEKRAVDAGAQSVYIELAEKDPEAAAKIHPNDIRRIVRALEVFYLTGIPISEHKKKTSGIAGGGVYDIHMFGIDIPRNALYRKINERVDKMFEAGIVDEVKGLLKRDLSVTARAALGIKEVGGYLEGLYDPGEAKEILKKNTRRYAKGQMTWFRADKRIRWFDGGEGIISHCGSLFGQR